MKNLLLVAIAFFTMNLAAQDQKVKQSDIKKETQNKSAKEIADMKTKKLTKQLELNSDQQKKVHAVMLEHAETNQKNKLRQKEALSSEKKANKGEIKQAIKKHKEKELAQVNDKLKNILTTEQYAKYEEMLLKKQNNKQKAKKKGKKKKN